MRFGRRRFADLGFGRRGIVPPEQLLRRTTFGIALTTMLLIAGLLAVVGVVTAAAAIEAADSVIDRDLAAAAHSMLNTLRPTPTPEPSEAPSIEPEDSGAPGDGGEPEDTPAPGRSQRPDNGDPQPTALSTPKPTKAPQSTASLGPEPSDRETEQPDATGAPRETEAATATGKPDDARTSGAGQRLSALVFSAPGPTPSPSASPPVGDQDVPPGSSDTFFLVLDLTGQVTANPQGVALTGLPDEEAVQAALQNGSDLRTVTAGGLHVRLLTQPVDDLQGSPIAVLQSGFVLTQHDEQVRQMILTIALVILIGLLGAALVTAIVTRRALFPVRSAFAAERRFVAAASHELRTPVAVVRASAEILQREELVRPEGRQVLDDIVSEADRLGRLVGDLLALASAEAGQISIHRQQIEMRSFVSDLVRRAEGMAAARGIRLETVQSGVEAPADHQLLVNADADRMTQLLLIFIDNAIEHSPRNGVVRLVVRPLSDGGRAYVSVGVVDQGPGVPLWDRERIFEPFARLAGQRRSAGGSGLGLAIARLLAARQDATLHVDDAPGGGAVFSVALPRRLSGESPALP
jgi:signal transduction histidine kinase